MQSSTVSDQIKEFWFVFPLPSEIEAMINTWLGHQSAGLDVVGIELTSFGFAVRCLIQYRLRRYTGEGGGVLRAKAFVDLPSRVADQMVQFAKSQPRAVAFDSVSIIGLGCCGVQIYAPPSPAQR
jgi:hypothetical protein